jgi:hypothetical protein
MEFVPALSIGMAIGVTVVLLARLILDFALVSPAISRATSSATGLARVLVRAASLSHRRARTTRLRRSRRKPKPPGSNTAGAAPTSPLTNPSLALDPAIAAASREPSTVSCHVCKRARSNAAEFCRWCGAPSTERA